MMRGKEKIFWSVSVAKRLMCQVELRKFLKRFSKIIQESVLYQK